MASDFPALDGLIGVRGGDQWLHCSFAAAGPACVALEGEIVQLATLPAAPEETAPAAAPAIRRGLALDRHGRLYRADPENRRITVRPLTRPGGFALPEPDQPLPDATHGPQHPAALAVTEDDHLFAIGDNEARVFVYDLLARRWRGWHALPRSPRDIAVSGSLVFVLLEPPSGWVALSICDAPRALSWPDGVGGASRLAFSPCGDAHVLLDAETPAARVAVLGRPRRSIAPQSQIPTPGGRDIAVCRTARGRELVVADAPGQPLRRFVLSGGEALRLPDLDGRTYDGSGILATASGRILFNARSKGRNLGPLLAVPARRSYHTSGEVVLMRLDSGVTANRWGRIFLDACLPAGTSVTPWLRTAEIPDEAPPAPRIAPANALAPPTLAGEALALMPGAAALADSSLWSPAGTLRAGTSEGNFATWEAPALVPPGRYLWIRLALTGKGSATPRLRRVMVERRGHDWLRHLPRAFARHDAATAGFLQAMLAPAAGMLADAGHIAQTRHQLFDPARTPVSALPWLGEMLGLPVEPEWPEPVARAMLAEATDLLRRRGTPSGLTRMLEILTGGAVTIVESWRLRAGGGIAPDETTGPRASTAVLGNGFRIGGGITSGETLLDPAADSAVERHAHRFTVLVHASLSPEIAAAAQRILDRHRPAHTDYTLCTVDAGLRAGIGGHVGLTTILGPGSGFMPAVVGSALPGRGSLIGRGGIQADIFGEGAQ